MSDQILEVRGLSRRYGATLALNDVNLSVGAGEFVALLGPSGCGKTTLLRCLGGFVEPTAGEILIGGKSMQGVPPNRRPVNTVFQNYALFPHLSVKDNVAYGPLRAGKSKAEVHGKVAGILEMVGLTALAGRYPSQLSGGQQQRVAIARAIINEPRVLLLDEPLGALDLKLRKHMQIELKRLQEKLGMTFIFVTHDQEEALVMADRIAVMHNGAVEQLGTGTQLYKEPASLFVADFIGDVNLIPVAQDPRGVVVLAGSGKPVGTLPPAAAAARHKLMVRPEDLHFCTDAQATGAGDLVFDGVLTSEIFVGDAVRRYVTLADGVELAVKTSGEAATQLAVTPDSPVRLRCRAGAARLFPAE